MAKTEMQNEIDLMVRRAFRQAEQYRAGKNLPRRVMVRQVKRRGSTDGPSKWHGPRKYKVTLWLPPWSYLDLLDRKRAAGYPGSLHRYIEKELGLKANMKELKAAIAAAGETTKRAATG